MIALVRHLLVSVYREEQEIHHKVTKVRALFFLVTFVGGESISVAFGQQETGAEKSQRSQYLSTLDRP